MTRQFCRGRKTIKETVIAGLMVLVILSGYGCAKLAELIELDEGTSSILVVEGDVSLVDNLSAFCFSGITVSVSGKSLDRNKQVVTPASGHYQFSLEPEVYLFSYSKKDYNTVTKNIQIKRDNVRIDMVNLSKKREPTPVPSLTPTPNPTLFAPATKADLITKLSDGYYTANTVQSCGDINQWDVSAIVDMKDLFRYKRSFNCDISSWDVSHVTTMSGMFYNATAFNGDMSSWDVSNVTTMSGMFWGASSFNGDMSSWDVSNVTTMYVMFNWAHSFNQDLSSWDVSNVTWSTDYDRQTDAWQSVNKPNF